MFDQEYINIVNDILKDKKFLKLKEEIHHYTTNRYDHCINVSYATYKACKRYNLDYINATRASLVHDFYLNNEVNSDKKLLSHPNRALINAKRLIKLNEKQENIILSHMFPFSKIKPESKESILVVLIDDYISIKERFVGDAKRVAMMANFFIIVLLNYVKYI